MKHRNNLPKLSNSRKHPVAMFIPTLRGGGAERAILDLARGLLQRNVPIDIVVGDAKGQYSALLPEGARIVDLSSWKTHTAYVSIYLYLTRARPAALVSTLIDADVVALLMKRLSSSHVPLIVRVVSPLALFATGSWKQKVIMGLWKHLLPAADAIVANSYGIENDLKRNVPSISHLVQTIHNPVVWPYISEQAGKSVEHPWFDRGQPPVILSAGRLCPEKDHSCLLKAFSDLVKSRPAHLMILGEGPDLHKLKVLARQLGIAHLVDFTGFHINPFAYMAKADVFVLTSIYEGMPNVLIQAMACGTQVVSTDCLNGPGEILEGGKYGRLVPVGDWRALARAILETLDRPVVDRNLLISKANAYNAESSIGRYLELLEVVTS